MQQVNVPVFSGAFAVEGHFYHCLRIIQPILCLRACAPYPWVISVAAACTSSSAATHMFTTNQKEKRASVSGARACHQSGR